MGQVAADLHGRIQARAVNRQILLETNLRVQYDRLPGQGWGKVDGISRHSIDDRLAQGARADVVGIGHRERCGLNWPGRHSPQHCAQQRQNQDESCKEKTLGFEDHDALPGSWHSSLKMDIVQDNAQLTWLGRLI